MSPSYCLCLGVGGIYFLNCLNHERTSHVCPKPRRPQDLPVVRRLAAGTAVLPGQGSSDSQTPIYCFLPRKAPAAAPAAVGKYNQMPGTCSPECICVPIYKTFRNQTIVLAESISKAP